MTRGTRAGRGIVAAMVLLLIAGGASLGEEWLCPGCGSTASGARCEQCGLIEPPEGMAYIDAGTVALDDGTVLDYEPFFIDTTPVTYRDVLPWLNSTIGSAEEWAMIITGQYDADLLFLKFTPFTSSADGSAITVPASCFDIPATSFTWEGARHFLSDIGKRLPSRAEFLAAWESGLVRPYDVYQLMRLYENVVTSTLGNVLGGMDRQAMFTPGYSSPEERVVWEWTRDAWNEEPDVRSPDLEYAIRAIARPLDPPQLGFAGRNNGYFNVAFRGVVPGFMPGEEMPTDGGRNDDGS